MPDRGPEATNEVRVLRTAQDDAINARNALIGGDEVLVPAAVAEARRAAYRAANVYLAAVNGALQAAGVDPHALPVWE